MNSAEGPQKLEGLITRHLRHFDFWLLSSVQKTILKLPQHLRRSFLFFDISQQLKVISYVTWRAIQDMSI